MKLQYIATLATASILTLSGTAFFSGQAIAFPNQAHNSSTIVAANPCAAVNPCAAANLGQFVAVGSRNKIAGTFNVVEENGKRYIEFSDDFQVSEGPDLEIILHKDSVVKSSIAEADYISLAPIESFTGTQRYAVPQNVNLDDYGSVSVWCEEFNVTFGYAKL